MSDELLLQFEKELAFINQSAGSFAQKHPAAASRLQLSKDTVDDPLVGKLLSGFAYLNARVQQKLNDDFPELTDAILDTVYPHYLRPFPSACIVQFEPDEQLDQAQRVERGEVLETDSYQGQTCKFTLTSAVDLLPLSVTQAALMPRPFIAPGSNDVGGAGAVLKITLKGLTPDIAIGELGQDRLRFFLRGLPQHINPLYDLLLTKSLRVVLARNEADPRPVFLPPEILQAAGFTENEALIPYPDTGFSGYRLLTEYFCFPEKFFFVEFSGLADAISSYANELNLYVYLSESSTELEHQINGETFALGCAPAINLFNHTADPIPLTHTEYAYQLVPDARSPEAHEIYSVDSVSATNSNGQVTTYKRFYGLNHADSESQAAYWFTRRSPVIEGEHMNEEASDVEISLVNLNFSPYSIADHTLEARLTCTNRNLPKRLPTGGGQPLMQPIQASVSARRIACVVPPTAAIRPPQQAMAYWRLISHLNLNYLSLTDGGGATEALKEILRLYDFRNSASTRKIIESVAKIHTQPMTAPIQNDGMVSLCRGTAVSLQLDKLMLSGVSAVLFASVLERFFGLYCSINSFTRLKAGFTGQEKEFKRWPPRAGEKALL